jgi:hypothetical protein
VAIILGTAEDDSLSGTDDAGDTIVAFGGSDNIDAGDGNDVVILGAGGSDTVDGGAGTDTVVLTGDFASYDISVSGGNLVLDNGTGTVETLTGVEVVVFDDHAMNVLTVDASGANGQFTSIQAAIDAAQDGDTIVVLAGTYDEDLTIDKGVTILGAHAGAAGTDSGRDAASSSGETNITGHHHVTADAAVTIDGVRFLNDATTTGGGPSNPTLQLASGYDHVVTNSIFYSTVQGGGAADDRAIALPPLATGNITISNNYITGDHTGLFSTASWGRGIWFDGGGVLLTVEGNTIEFARTGINLDMSGDSEGTIDGNTFHSNGTATSLGVDTDGVQILGNNYENVGTEFNLRNLTGDVVFDAEAAVASLIPAGLGNDAVVVLGGSGHDNLSGTSGADIIDANNHPTLGATADNDVLNGRGGDDLLFGRAGNDRLDGGTGADSMTGGTGDDTYVVDDVGDVVTELANEGTDTVETTLLTYTLGADLESLTFTGTGNFKGTGNTADNVITGGDGNDRLSGGKGHNTLDGGEGNDTYLIRSVVNDTVMDSGGIDTIKSLVSLNLDAYAGDIEKGVLLGTADLDLTGNELANTLTGNSGDNTITGGGGRDALTGGDGGDRFDFNDVSDSGVGAANRDVITDFEQGTDLIDLLTIDAKDTAGGNNAFVWIDTGAFTGSEGQLRYSVSGANTIVQGDVDGDGSADFQIQLKGAFTTLNDGDFIL